MKTSYNWLKAYLDFDLSVEKTSELLTDIGLEVEGIENFESLKGGLEGIVVGKVLTCVKHPDADKLSITTVDLGGEVPVQIVCGAPNVAAGKTVIVAKVGTTLYPEKGDPFKIKKAKIRGVESIGMICAEDEIGLGESHDGIMVLSDEYEAGMLASDLFEIEKDIIFEIGLTPNRSDATSHIGVAKDLRAALVIRNHFLGELMTPDISKFSILQNLPEYKVSLENAEKCPRYSGILLEGITVAPSPKWLQNRLNSIGIRPINNVVDITNFILHEQGQPLHAFDADKIGGNEIIVKTCKDGTIFKTLDEVDRKLHSEDLMICDGTGKGMCIGGVFGGLNSGVTDNTTTIFLESAHFSARTIRRSSTQHGLRTDAARCFEKGSDPNNNVIALKRAVLLLQELAGAKIASQLVDIYPNTITPVEVEVKYSRINRLIGDELKKEDVKSILNALSLDIISETENGLKLAIPTDKADVTREVDVIEEVLRIYGFNKVAVPTTIKSTLQSSSKPDAYKVANEAGAFLVGLGFSEIMATSISQSKYFKNTISDKEMVFINNTSNKHLDVMRPSMLFGGLESILHNQNRQNSSLKLFEFGKSYVKNKENYIEHKSLVVFLTGNKRLEAWNEETKPVSIYDLKSLVDGLLMKLGLGSYQSSESENTDFSYGLKYHRGPQTIVEFGLVDDVISQGMGIKKEVFYAEINWGVILKALRNKKIEFQALAKYPTVRRDLALVLDANTSFSEIEDIAKKAGKKLLNEINLFDIYQNEEQLGKGKKSYAISFLFQNTEKTLSDKEVEKVMSQITKVASEKLNAVIR